MIPIGKEVEHDNINTQQKQEILVKSNNKMVQGAYWKAIPSHEHVVDAPTH